ncbi:MAG: PUA domain-containing protein, partial [Planctomycetia bacterium]
RLVMAGEPIGTLMPAKGDGLAAWKRWIGFSVRPKGSLRVDAGAVAALSHKQRSLLPVGIVDVVGSFVPGDVVSVETMDGVVFARGLTNYSSEEARTVMGQPTSRLAELLPAARYDEIVHRDNLVLL